MLLENIPTEVSQDLELNSLVWSQDVNNGDPLLCVAGSPSSVIRILNVRTGKHARVGALHDAIGNPSADRPVVSRWPWRGK